MYAIKLELKLNHKECTLMARHSGYARFCYNYALALYQGVTSLPGGTSKKVAAIERVFTNHVKKFPNISGRILCLPEFIKPHSGILVQHYPDALKARASSLNSKEKKMATLLQ
jgi:Helix-turn-helix domain